MKERMIDAKERQEMTVRDETVTSKLFLLIVGSIICLTGNFYGLTMTLPDPSILFPSYGILLLLLSLGAAFTFPSCARQSSVRR